MSRRWLWLGGGIIALIVIGVLVERIGAISIRRAEQIGSEISLSLPQAVVPGVQTTVGWVAPPGFPNSEVAILVRTVDGEEEIGRGRLGDEKAVVIFPCSLGHEQASVLMTIVEGRTRQQLVDWQPVTVLPAGPDCIY